MDKEKTPTLGKIFGSIRDLRSQKAQERINQFKFTKESFKKEIENEIEYLGRCCERKGSESDGFKENCRLIAYFKGTLELISRNDELIEQRDDLLAACKRVQGWLDTSSLQEYLVHGGDKVVQNCCIVGVANMLIALEDAIAKVEKTLASKWSTK